MGRGNRRDVLNKRNVIREKKIFGITFKPGAITGKSLNLTTAINMKSKHGGVGNKNACKPKKERLTQARIQLTMPIDLKLQCEEAAKLEGQKVVAWIRDAMMEKLKNNTT